MSRSGRPEGEMRRTWGATRTVSLVAAMIVCGFAGSANAQLRGHYLAGFTGVGDGSQGPPSITVVFPVYVYTTDTIKDNNGDSLGAPPAITSVFFAPGLAWVSNFKLLGGNWGGQVLPVAYRKQQIEGTSLDVPGGYRFTDIYAQPFQLGWSKPRTDFVVGWGFFVPSGKWNLGGDDNGGLGMLSNIFQGGIEVHDRKREWSVSTLGTYEINSEKMNGGITDTNITVGNIMTFEGGFGRSFYRTASGTSRRWNVTLGVPYYAQFKVTADKVPGLTTFLSQRKDRVFGVGVEGSVFIPRPGLQLGLRVVPEFGAVDRTQGVTWMLNLSYQLRSLIKVTPP